MLSRTFNGYHFCSLLCKGKLKELIMLKRKVKKDTINTIINQPVSFLVIIGL